MPPLAADHPRRSTPLHTSLPLSVLAMLGSLLPRRRGEKRTRRDSQIVHAWREDSDRGYPVSGLTPSRAVALAQAADAGDPRMLFELYDEMLLKWPRLAAVEATRRLALTGLDWQIEGEDARAAEYCRRALARIPNFRDALEHLASAIGRGVAVCELVWSTGELSDIVPVPHSRLCVDAYEPWRLRIRTASDPTRGVAIDAQPRKWLVHAPGAAPGRWFAGGLLRASMPLFVAQYFNFRNWLTFSEIAGMPVRVARFEPSATEAEKRDMLSMLRALGSDAVAAFSKSIDVQMLESRGGEKPYQPLADYSNTEITILWLGQHLTTDIKSSGSRAAAEIHDRVREDLLVDNIRRESDSIGRGLLAPLVESQFGAGAALPRFRRSLIESVDTKVLAETLVLAVRELGLRVSSSWAHRALGLPQAASGEATIRVESKTGARSQ